mmetsp:Transcript_141372/g.368121  ORF Transcript_141372/g.368121 Transcript_141372/m.368121 type:complete len:238 (-) Transcript_141372:1134-1847(-)
MRLFLATCGHTQAQQAASLTAADRGLVPTGASLRKDAPRTWSHRGAGSLNGSGSGGCCCLRLSFRTEPPHECAAWGWQWGGRGRLLGCRVTCSHCWRSPLAGGCSASCSAATTSRGTQWRCVALAVVHAAGLDERAKHRAHRWWIDARTAAASLREQLGPARQQHGLRAPGRAPERRSGVYHRCAVEEPEPHSLLGRLRPLAREVRQCSIVDQCEVARGPLLPPDYPRSGLCVEASD